MSPRPAAPGTTGGRAGVGRAGPTIGFDSFSYHRYFGETTPWEQPVDVAWTTEDVLDRAVEVGAEVVSLQTCYLPIDPATAIGMSAVADLADRVRDRGLGALFAWGHRDGLQGGTSRQRVVDARAWITAAAAFDVPLLRIVAGDQHHWSTSVADRTEHLVPILRQLASWASELGVALAVENHADFAMRDLVALVERVGADNLGICLDLGNVVRVGDQLAAAVGLAVPHVRMVHVKDLKVQPASIGDPAAWWPTVPLGTGDLGARGAIKGASDGAADGALDAALVATLAAPALVGWFVEMAAMHPDAPDEDAAVASGIVALRRRRAGSPLSPPTSGRAAGRRR